MKKRNVMWTVMCMVISGLFAQESTDWNLLNKDFSSDYTGWTIAKGGNLVATQEPGHVNITKEATQKWAWFKPETPFADLETGEDYSIVVRVRLGDATADPSNQVSLRLSPENVRMPFYLAYGDGETGYISASQHGTNPFHLNTSEFQEYGIYVHADHATYDIYVNGELAIPNVGKSGDQNNDANGVYFGSESNKACDMDIAYVRMGKGNLIKASISAIELSQEVQAVGVETTLDVTVHTDLLGDGTVLLCSLVDGQGKTIVPTVEVTVVNDVATAQLTIPATVSVGEYAVKVEAKDNAAVTPLTVPYAVKEAGSLQWNVLDRDFREVAWNEGAEPWTLSKNRVSESFVTSTEEGVSLYKTDAGGSWYYAFLLSPEVTVAENTEYTFQVEARVRPINKEEFPDLDEQPASGQDGGFEANQIAFQQDGKLMSIFLLCDTEAVTGYVSSQEVSGTGINPSAENRAELKTSDWHVYSLVSDAEEATYDVYVDGKQVLTDQGWGNKSGANTVKLGGESWQRFNMDVRYVRIGEGNLVQGGGTTDIAVLAGGEGLTVSRTVLYAGESLSVVAGADQVLSEAVFYSLTGKEMDRISIQSSTSEVQVPAMPGMYVLRVVLDDNTAKDFKVLVK